MPDKGFSEEIDNFFDVRSLAAVLIGFILTKWIETLLILWIGMNPSTMAIIWPILFFSVIILMANAGKKTNQDLKNEKFQQKIETMIQKIEHIEDEQDDE